VLKAYADYVVAFRDVAFKEKELAALETADPQVFVREAEAGVKQAEAAEHKAQTAIDLCTVKAKSAGTIERVTIGEGSTLGISTREPALWLIPAGSRIVRAEVEAEFAHRVGKDLEGKEVLVFDNSDPRLVYHGKVRYIGGTFLPKRSAGDSLLGNDTRVLEAVVEIADPAPAGKPPLRVGQRVRVGLGQ
jgi:multidrug resistance efflux pump